MKLFAAVFCSLFALLFVHAPAEKRESEELSELWAASLRAESEGEYDEALARTAEFARAGGEEFLSILRAGWLHYLAGDLEEAAASYNRAANQKSAALSPRLGLLNVARATQDPKKILAAAERVLAIDPNHYSALMAAAGVEYVAQEYRKALIRYQRLHTLYPEDLDAISGVAWSTVWMGKRREAAALFERILSVAPSYPAAREGLELCLQKR